MTGNVYLNTFRIIMVVLINSLVIFVIRNATNYFNVEIPNMLISSGFEPSETLLMILLVNIIFIVAMSVVIPLVYFWSLIEDKLFPISSR